MRGRIQPYAVVIRAPIWLSKPPQQAQSLHVNHRDRVSGNAKPATELKKRQHLAELGVSRYRFAMARRRRWIERAK